MKKENKKRTLSLKSWLTMCFSVLMTAVGVLIVVFVFVSSREVVDTDMEKQLIERVEYNVKRIDCSDGTLAVRDDFISVKNGIYAAVYDENGKWLYGRMLGNVGEYALTDRTCRSVRINGTDYYIYDQCVQVGQLGTLWVRGLSPASGTETKLSPLSRLALVLLPAAIVLAVVGGYVITGQMLLPLEDVTKAANSIAADADLSQRIRYSGSAREIEDLTTAFNNMFSRLDNSFRRERQFTSDVSHELRTPLAVVLAECEYSLSNELTNEEYRQSLETVQRQAQRMTGLITQLLNISRLERGTEKLCFEKTDLGELVLAVCEDQQQITDVKIVPVIKNEAYADVDITLMTRLLANLIGNACKFGSSNVYVRLGNTDGQISIAVEDDGIGIPKSEQEKIWERFYQVDPSRSENQSGSCGLGLSMVRQIAQIHGGTVTLESVPGEGSTFTFRLPESK